MLPSLLALVLSATFNLAPGTVSAECRAFERHIVAAAPVETTRWLCPGNYYCRYSMDMATTHPGVTPCEIRNGNSEMWTVEPIVGQVIIFSVRGIDPNGARSPWTGGP